MGNITYIRLGKYPYTAARVAAMRAKLLKKDDYVKLMKLKISEIAKYLMDSEYKKQINKYGVSLSGTPLIEAALRQNIVDDYSKLNKISHGALKTIISEYLKKEDIENLKVILRGKTTKTDTDEIRALLVPVGEYDLETLNSFIREDDFEKILKLAKLMKYEEIRTAIKKFKDKNELEIIEAAIDKVFYRRLMSFIRSLPYEARAIKNFISAEIDAINIRVVFKFKKESIGEDVLKKLLFISGLSNIPKNKWDKIIAAKSIEGLKKEFEGTIYYNIIKDGIDELSKKGTLSGLDLGLQRFQLDYAGKKSIKNPLSADAVFSYISKKQIEIRNLHIIVKSKQLGLKEDFIEKELLI